MRFAPAKLLDLPLLAKGGGVLFAAMPAGANASVFGHHQRLVNPVSAAVALGTLLAAVMFPVVVWVATEGVK